jgi:hypothetical protein
VSSRRIDPAGLADAAFEQNCPRDYNRLQMGLASPVTLEQPGDASSCVSKTASVQYQKNRGSLRWWMANS